MSSNQTSTRIERRSTGWAVVRRDNGEVLAVTTSQATAELFAESVEELVRATVQRQRRAS